MARRQRTETSALHFRRHDGHRRCGHGAADAVLVHAEVGRQVARLGRRHGLVLAAGVETGRQAAARSRRRVRQRLLPSEETRQRAARRVAVERARRTQRRDAFDAAKRRRMAPVDADGLGVGVGGRRRCGAGVGFLDAFGENGRRRTVAETGAAGARSGATDRGGAAAAAAAAATDAARVRVTGTALAAAALRAATGAGRVVAGVILGVSAVRRRRAAAAATCALSGADARTGDAVAVVGGGVGVVVPLAMEHIRGLRVLGRRRPATALPASIVDADGLVSCTGSFISFRSAHE